jgi:TetR/AcrR family transcriptional regulator, transcriptional repressor for nem operon
MIGSRELRVKVSSEKVAEHRAALVATARRLLQERGFDGAAVTEISRAAGLTQGALYGQFKSKDALAAEAIRNSVAERAAFWDDLRDKAPNALLALLDAYLCEAHAEDPGAGCTLAACVSEIGRQDVAIADAYAEGFRRLADLVQQSLPTGTSPEEARRRSIALVSGMVGGVAIARALNKVDPELAKEVLVATREELERLGLSTSVPAAI